MAEKPEKEKALSLEKGVSAADKQTSTARNGTVQGILFDFEVNTGGKEDNSSVSNFSFLCDKEGKPIKIGDGTFGIVFKVQGRDLKPYAVKILYNHSRSSGHIDTSSATIVTQNQDLSYTAAKDRFDNEVKAMLSIREALKEELDRREIGAIVEHIGSTTKFPVEKLKRTQGNIDLSTHALVLDYYHGTLKDLLENKNVRTTTGLSGYELLRDMDVSERIRTILPFLRGIASGLNTMHKAGYVHLDIKPANIFWQNVGDDEIKAAIGDLGYIRKFRNSHPDPVRSESQAALGTLHYRSPEQKDFQDTCEVEILKQGDDKSIIRLRTTDPKFSDTIIEEGDNLQFLNNVTRDYEVKSIENHKGITTIEILNPSKEFKWEPDKGTQVKIFKNQGVRTDIYGFGAIAYDLITCGKSPERFYSYLAMYDHKDSKNEGVQTIIDNYVDNIETRSKRTSIYSSVFEHFHDHEKHQSVPSKLVSLILKCMLYHLQGTYYRENGDKAFDAIREDLVKLDDEYRGIREITRNVLISGKSSKNDGHGDTKICELRRYIDEIQNIGVGNEKQSTLLTRIYLATLRFDRLIDLVRNNKTGLLQQDYQKYDYTEETEENHTKFFFAELTPELVSVVDGDKLEFKSTVYNKMTQYIIDLRANRISGKLIHYPLEPFSPHDILGDMKRKIELCDAGSSNKNEYRYNFVEASVLGDSIKPGDWIVVHPKEVRRIKSFNRDIVELYCPVKTQETPPETNSGTDSQAISFETQETTPETNSGTDSQAISFETQETTPETNSGTDSLEQSCFDDKNSEFYYYRNLDPMLYYVSMLGEYIYQLFFVGLGNNSISTPKSVKSVKAQLESSPSMQKDLWVLLKKSLDTETYSKGRDMTERVSRLFRRLAALYLVLSLTDQKAFLSKHKPTDAATEIDTLVKIWLDIRDDVEKCLELNPGEIEGHQEETFELIRSQLESYKMDEHKLQIDLTTHFQNMLRNKG